MSPAKVGPEQVSATLDVPAPIDRVFAALADPTTHADVDGTGWVQSEVDAEPLRRVGQVFRMTMFHAGHPDGRYETANEVLVLDPPHAIAWRTGHETVSGELAFGGWTWRYDLLAQDASTTSVTLTYDWSAVGPEPRTYLRFPPFGDTHLADSLRHLAAIVAR